MKQANEQIRTKITPTACSNRKTDAGEPAVSRERQLQGYLRVVDWTRIKPGRLQAGLRDGTKLQQSAISLNTQANK